MKIGDCVQLRTKEGPLLCITGDRSLTGDPVDQVYCCYWHKFKEEFVYLRMHKYILMIVDPESSEEVRQD